MRRALIAALIALTLPLAAAPALAQTVDEPTSATEPAPPVTDIGPGGIEVTGTALSVDGKSVDAAPTGVEVTLTLTLRNASEDPLKGVAVVLGAPPENVRFLDDEASIGDLAPGESADGEFVFVVSGDCFEFLGIGGEATFDGGSTPLKIALPATCPGPRLSLSNVIFEGGDGDDAAEPGETLRVTFELTNTGKDVAKNVRATVKVSGDGVKAAGTTLEWPDIAPNGSARNRTPMILTIEDDAQRQKPCEPLPQPLPVEDDPGIAVDGKSLPPDTAVSSDGTVSSGSGTATGEPGSAPGSEPADGGGSAGSTGSDGTSTEEPGVAEGPPTAVDPQPSQVDPDPGQGSTEPAPGTGGGTEPGVVEPEPVPPDQIIEPMPMPEPVEPQPAEDMPVPVHMTLAVSADDHETAAEWSNQMFCMAERGLATDATPLAAKGARDDAAPRSAGGATAPVSIAFGVSALAVLARRKLLG